MTDDTFSEIRSSIDEVVTHRPELTEAAKRAHKILSYTPVVFASWLLGWCRTAVEAEKEASATLVAERRKAGSRHEKTRRAVKTTG